MPTIVEFTENCYKQYPAGFTTATRCTEVTARTNQSQPLKVTFPTKICLGLFLYTRVQVILLHHTVICFEEARKSHAMTQGHILQQVRERDPGERDNLLICWITTPWEAHSLFADCSSIQLLQCLLSLVPVQLHYSKKKLRLANQTKPDESYELQNTCYHVLTLIMDALSRSFTRVMLWAIN